MSREFHAATSSYSSFKRLRAGCGVLTMRTSAHLTSFSTTCSALGDFRSSVIPRLLRLARCHGYGSFACGCGGIWCACLQRSPLGGSTLMTSAPKSDRITAALGPAMKLAKSTTFNPEKMLSLVMSLSAQSFVCGTLVSSPLESRRALFEEGVGAFLLVLGCGAEAEVRGLEPRAFALARFEPLVRRLERELDGDRSVGGDLLQDCFSARDQFSRRDDFVDESDTIGLLRGDRLSGQDELQRATLADETRQALCSAAARNESERDFGLAELRTVRRDPDRARHRRLTATAERETIDRRDDRLSQIFDDIENLLSKTAGLFCLERCDMRELADIGAGDECLVARARQNDTANRRVVSRVLE